MLQSRMVNQKGYTLVEIIVYVVIFSFVGVALINVLINLTTNFAITRINRTLQETGTSVLSRIENEVNNAYTVDVVYSNLGGHPGDLYIYKDEFESNTLVRFYIDNDVVYISEDDSLLGPLSSSSVDIDNLIFDHIVTSQGQALRVSLSLSASQGSITRSADFFTTLILRESY
ncbi:MAG: type II secretory pathway pseudopilin PulG [Flavobacteriaceae bacterium]|jgi:type II secretory pathway pseudopilin PulG